MAYLISFGHHTFVSEQHYFKKYFWKPNPEHFIHINTHYFQHFFPPIPTQAPTHMKWHVRLFGCILLQESSNVQSILLDLWNTIWSLEDKGPIFQYALAKFWALWNRWPFCVLLGVGGTCIWWTELSFAFNFLLDQVSWRSIKFIQNWGFDFSFSIYIEKCSRYRKYATNA